MSAPSRSNSERFRRAKQRAAGRVARLSTPVLLTLRNHCLDAIDRRGDDLRVGRLAALGYLLVMEELRRRGRSTWADRTARRAAAAEEGWEFAMEATQAGRTCPFDGCGEAIPSNRFACRTHWFKLTVPERDRIVGAYRLYLNDRLGLEELRAIQKEVLDAWRQRQAGSR